MKRKEMKNALKKVTLIALILFCMGIMIGCEKRTVNLNDYVALAFEGIDTEGKASVNINYMELRSELVEIIGSQDSGDDIESMEDLEDSLLLEDKMERILKCFEFTVSPAEHLSNGDVVSVTATIDETKAKELGISFKFDDINMEVTGLKEAKMISEEELFNNIELDFIGVSPDIEVQIRNISKDSFISEIDFVADKTEGLEKGDIITIVAQVDEEKAVEKGYLLESDKKEYEVKNVDEYITNINEIDQETLTQILNQANDLIRAKLLTKKQNVSVYQGDDYIGDITYADTMSNPAMATSYFYRLKDGAEPDGFYNAMDIVYTFDVNIKPGFGVKGGECPGSYFAISCYNIIKNVEGEIIFNIDNMDFTSIYTSKDSFSLKVMEPWAANYYIEEITLEEK
ncbi:MAG: hypothetical protein V8S08_12645 [Lachnoclostridium sp.]